jgi:hypothetical protein
MFLCPWKRPQSKIYPEKSKRIYLAALFVRETWTLIVKSTATVLRRIYGPVCINGTWRTRSNRELESPYSRPDIVAEIKSRRIGNLGQVLRTESNRVPQKTLDGRLEEDRDQDGWMMM